MWRVERPCQFYGKEGARWQLRYSERFGNCQRSLSGRDQLSSLVFRAYTKKGRPVLCPVVDELMLVLLAVPIPPTWKRWPFRGLSLCSNCHVPFSRMEDLVLARFWVNFMFLIVQHAVSKGDGQGLVKGGEREISAFQSVPLTLKHRLCALLAAPCSLCTTEDSKLWHDKRE